MEGRGKVAFDPRDFQDGGESKEVPKLTLLEEVLLLGLKDNQVRSAPFILLTFPFLSLSSRKEKKTYTHKSIQERKLTAIIHKF